MVSLAWHRNRAGRVRLGCIVSALVFVGIAYYGLEFFRVRYRYYQIQDEVKTQAAFAASAEDRAILQRLVAKSDELGLPLGPRQWTIRRTRDPQRPGARVITIHAQYEDSVVLALPGFRKVWRFTFTPSAENFF